MKKAFYTLIFLTSALLCHAQALKIADVQKQIQGSWLTHGDTICEIVVTADSITTFRFKLGGVSRCSYKLNTEPCAKAMAFPAATGVYLTQLYKNTTVCCALAQLTPTTLKIIYPSGYQLIYTNEAVYLKNGK